MFNLPPITLRLVRPHLLSSLVPSESRPGAKKAWLPVPSRPLLAPEIAGTNLVFLPSLPLMIGLENLKKLLTSLFNWMFKRALDQLKWIMNPSVLYVP